MLLRNLWRAALAATAVLPFSIAKDDEDEGGQSTFVSPDGNVAFAIDIGENVDTEVYWSLRVKKDLSWGAVGLGSPDMPGALYLIIYKHPDGSSVTFSPRTAYGHFEPKYYEDMKYDILESKSGIKGDYMYMTVRCMERCRSWPGEDTGRGVLDVYNTNKAIYAYGPKEDYHSKEQDAPLKYHKGYGVFQIDVGRTHGKSELPSINDSTTNVGSKLLSEDGFKPKPNWMSPVHGVFMVLSIVLLMPVGVVLLRSGGGVKWHALNQVIATVGVLAGFGIGVANSFYYQRSRSFNDPHQVIGFMVTGLLLGQFGLGVMHHTQFKKTKAPTKYGRVHLWVGRIILFLGTLNAFMGFTLALNRKWGMLLAILIIFICLTSLILIYGRRFIEKRRRGPRGPGLAGPHGYSAEPWRQQPPQHMGYPSEPPPGYEPPSNQPIGLAPLSPATPSPWRSEAKDDESDLNIGREQRPREFT